MWIVRFRRFLQPSFRNAIQPVLEMFPLETCRRGETRHTFNLQHMEPGLAERDIPDAPEILSAHDEAVRGARLDAGRIDVARVGIGGREKRGAREDERGKKDAFHA